MGIFGFKKEKKAEKLSFPAIIGAPTTGEFVTMKEIPDKVFSQGMMGICCGVNPEEGKVYAPVNGKISMVADTLHAVGIEADGLEILIHVGLDTVDMNGDGFTKMVREQQAVKKGDLLLTMDLDKIRAAGHPATVIMVITNSGDYASVEEKGSDRVKAGASLLCVSK